MYTLFGIRIANIGPVGVLTKIQDFLRDDKKHLIVTANPEIMVYAHNHVGYAKVLQNADLVVPDGIGLILASYLDFCPLTKGRITGVELVENLVKDSQSGGYSIFLTGESDSVLQKATLNFSLKYGKTNIVGYKPGPIFNSDVKFPIKDKINDELLQELQNKKPDILLVAFGHPKQELWLDYYLSKLTVKVAIGIGGALDYFAGNLTMPPLIFKRLGLEWLWRLILQPRRLFRIIRAVIIFPVIVIIDKFKSVLRRTN